MSEIDFWSALLRCRWLNVAAREKSGSGSAWGLSTRFASFLRGGSCECEILRFLVAMVVRPFVMVNDEGF